MTKITSKPRDNVGIPSSDLMKMWVDFLRDPHLMDLVAEELRLLAAEGLTPDAVGARTGASAASRMGEELEAFLTWLDDGPDASAPCSAALGALHQQAILAYVERFTDDPKAIVAIAQTLAAYNRRLTRVVEPLPDSLGSHALSAVIHDLRSPLNALNVLDATMTNQLPPLGVKMLGIASRNTERLADMLDGLPEAVRAIKVQDVP